MSGIHITYCHTHLFPTAHAPNRYLHPLVSLLCVDSGFVGVARSGWLRPGRSIGLMWSNGWSGFGRPGDAA